MEIIVLQMKLNMSKYGWKSRQTSKYLISQLDAIYTLYQDLLVLLATVKEQQIQPYNHHLCKIKNKADSMERSKDVMAPCWMINLIRKSRTF